MVYFKRYDTYPDTHEVIFNMYQQHILSDFRPKKLDISTNVEILMTKISYFFSKNILFEISYN